MLIHIDTKRGVPYYRQVKEQITQMILTGQLQPGDQLESVAKLSKRLKVNPMTISKAYSFMVEENLLERKPGIGVFVGSVPQNRQDNMSRDLLTKTLNKAAVLTIQMGMDETEVQSIFSNELQKAKNQKEGLHDN